VILTVCFCPNIFVYIIIGLFRSQVIFFAIIHFCFIHVFVSSIICTNLHGYSRNRNRSFVLLCVQYIYWFLSLKIIIGLHYKGYWVWFVDFIFLNSKKKKTSCEVKGVVSILEWKTLIFVLNTRGVRIYFMPLTKFYIFKECLKTTNQWHKTLTSLFTCEP